MLFYEQGNWCLTCLLDHGNNLCLLPTVVVCGLGVLLPGLGMFLLLILIFVLVSISLFHTLILGAESTTFIGVMGIWPMWEVVAAFFAALLLFPFATSLTAGHSWRATNIIPQFITGVSSISLRALVLFIYFFLCVNVLSEDEFNPPDLVRARSRDQRIIWLVIGLMILYDMVPPGWFFCISRYNTNCWLYALISAYNSITSTPYGLCATPIR